MREAVVRALLDDHSPESLHDDILDAVGLAVEDEVPLAADSAGAITGLRGLHGKPLRAPVPGFAPVAIEFIHWHRTGVFQGRPLPT